MSASAGGWQHQGLLATILGGGSGGGGVGAGRRCAAAGGAAGRRAGTAIAGPMAVKGASIAAAIVIGAGAAGMSGGVKMPLLGPTGRVRRGRTRSAGGAAPARRTTAMRAAEPAPRDRRIGR